MIFEMTGNIVFAVVEWLFELLPDISWDIDIGIADTFFDLLECAFYFLPMQIVVVLLLFVININILKIVISVVKTIWELLPFV